MKTTIQLFTAAVCTLGMMAGVQAAPKSDPASRITSHATMNYVCKQGGNLTVKYAFNKPGIPVTATTKISKANRVMKYNMALSNNMDTYFNDARGYKLGMESMERDNVRNKSIITVTDNSDRIVYRDCSPRRR